MMDGMLNDRNFLDRAKNFCEHINGEAYDETLYGVESNPMETESTEAQETMESAAAPPDVIIPSNDRVNPETDWIRASPDMDESETYDQYNEGSDNWSATATMEEMVRRNGPAVNLDTFQILVREMIRDKCWTERDVNDFVAIMETIQRIVDANNDDERMNLLMNPVYYNAIQELLDKLDTINGLCVFGTGNKCSMIKNPDQRAVMEQQVEMIGKIVDTYTPIFLRILVLIESFTANLSEESSCEIDPIYLETLGMIKNKVVGSIYMRRLSKLNTGEPYDVLRSLANGTESEIPGITPGVNANVDAGPYQTVQYVAVDTTKSDYTYTFLLILIVGIIIYMIVRKD